MNHLNSRHQLFISLSLWRRLLVTRLHKILKCSVGSFHSTSSQPLNSLPTPVSPPVRGRALETSVFPDFRRSLDGIGRLIRHTFHGPCYSHASVGIPKPGLGIMVRAKCSVDIDQFMVLVLVMGSFLMTINIALAALVVQHRAGLEGVALRSSAERISARNVHSTFVLGVCLRPAVAKMWAKFSTLVGLLDRLAHCSVDLSDFEGRSWVPADLLELAVAIFHDLSVHSVPILGHQYLFGV